MLPLTVREFATAAKTTLPVLGVDLPSAVLAQLALTPENWVHDDAAWRSTLAILGNERQLGEALRSALSTCDTPFAYLYPLRDGKAVLISLHPK